MNQIKSERKLNRKGDKRGMHANSRRNLRPWKTGQSGNPKGRPVRYDPYRDPRFIDWMLRLVKNIP